MQDSPTPYLCRWDAHVPLQPHGRDTDGSTKLQLKSAENLKYRAKACSGGRPARFAKMTFLSQSKSRDWRALTMQVHALESSSRFLANNHMNRHMVYLFAPPRCPAPQSLSGSCNKFGKSMVHTNLTYLKTPNPVRSSRNCRASPSTQSQEIN